VHQNVPDKLEALLSFTKKFSRPSQVSVVGNAIMQDLKLEGQASTEDLVQERGCTFKPSSEPNGEAVLYDADCK
jgi:hypothetical protein